MPHRLTGIDRLDNLHLNGPVSRKPRHLTVTVGGEERDATWKEGVGIYVSGHDFGKGDTVDIEGESHKVVEMRRMMLEGEAVTLVTETRSVG